jgi:hypothetical protein
VFPRNGLCLKRMKDARTAKGGRRGLASSKIIGYACGDTFEKVVGEDGETCLRHGFTFTVTRRNKLTDELTVV